MISQSRWIFYCLPDFVDIQLQKVALYHCKFMHGNEKDKKFITASALYFRWGSFAESLIECKEGLIIGDDLTFERLISNMVENPLDTYLSLNRKSEEAFIIRRFLL